MEGLRYLESWNPRVGQRWHCKSTKASYVGLIIQLRDDQVLVDVAGVGERWLHVEVLKEHFFPLTVGGSMVC